MKTKLLRTLTVILAVIFLCNTGVYAAGAPWRMDSRRAEHGSTFGENQQMPVPKDRQGKEISRPNALFCVIRYDENGNKKNAVFSTGYTGLKEQDDNPGMVEITTESKPDYTLAIDKSEKDGNDTLKPYTLYCNVGDTIKFKDWSIATNQFNNINDTIASWDWQYWGVLGESDPKDHIYNYNIVNKTEYKITKPGESRFFLCVKSSTRPHRNSDWAWSVNGSHQSEEKTRTIPKVFYGILRR